MATTIKIPEDIKWKPAIAYNTGRNGVKIDRIVIHSTEGSYQSSVDWLCRNPTPSDEGSSCHYVINELGTEITQIVKDSDTAWHAGNFAYNQRSIGVEHSWYSDSDNKKTWKGDMADGLYRTGAKLVAYLCYKYNLIPDRNTIIGHNQVPPPNDHTDPNKDFNWTKYMAYVAQEYAVLIKPTTLSFSQTFSQTGYTVDDKLGFLSFWRGNGGLAIFGYPISGVVEQKEDKKQVQWFERARFESLPDKKVVLGLVGSELLGLKPK